ncbi:hypothetical protein B0E43_05765 [Algoriphagus sp. A40]|nr:hypothetical protein B0E43_05765 [Algoriphagus sp. A40]
MIWSLKEETLFYFGRELFDALNLGCGVCLNSGTRLPFVLRAAKSFWSINLRNRNQRITREKLRAEKANFQRWTSKNFLLTFFSSNISILYIVDSQCILVWRRLVRIF